ncbi:MAG TPA: hypothetical protein VNO55_06960, partial [Polyangia bacterium]|nr:hypothetical protein [Polyangia bacterium]
MTRQATRLLFGALLGVLSIIGEARADYNIKATEAAQSSYVEGDGKCNLVEAIDSLNQGKTGAGQGLHGCSNTGGGTRIVLEGTGAHYKVPQAGVSIGLSGMEITSKVANRDFVEGNVDQRVILVQVGKSLTLRGVTIQRTGSFKAQVLNNQGTLILSNSVVQNGDALLEGGGVFNTGDLRLETNTKVQNNKTGKNGGGIYTQGSIGVTIQNSTLSGNQSSFSGAGLYSNGSPVTVIASTVSSNKASSNGGGIYNASGDLTIDSTTFQSNTAIKNGGGIYSYLGSVSVFGGKLTGAHTAANGGAIFITSDETAGYVNLNATTVEGATVSGDGGGIYTQGYQN